MSVGNLRVVEPDEHPAPRIDDDSAHDVGEAVDALAKLRTPCWIDDTAVRLHALASLIQTGPTATPARRGTRPRSRPHLEADRPTAQHLTRSGSTPLPTEQVTNP
jgi:hypothetical protein